MPGADHDRDSEPIDSDTSDRLDSAHGDPDQHRRLLELELAKVRSEALAARLEARAAELELAIRQMAFGSPLPVAQTPTSQSPAAQSPATQLAENTNASKPVIRKQAAGDSHPISESSRQDLATPTRRPRVFVANDAENGDGETQTPTKSSAPQVTSRFQSWDALRAASGLVPAKQPATSNGQSNDTKPSVHRIDSAATLPAAPHFDGPKKADDKEDDVDKENDQSNPTSQEVVTRRFDPAPKKQRKSSPVIAATATALLDDPDSESKYDDATSEDVEIESDHIDEEDVQRGRRKPAAWLLSTAAHVAILLLLAACTLTSRTPKDQVALTASVSDPTEEVMETFEFESTEPVSETTQPTESEVEYDISPIGEMSVAEMSPDAAPAPPTPNISDMLNPSQMSAASMSLKPKSETVTKFCGVEGGGNHFVYLVDSSGSMGTAFESARAELLRAVDSLKPDQRFYVVFFDAESDYMRLSDPAVDESGSVKATAENKQALRRWAMRISKDRGRAPYDPLKFALKLRPDVIFLLSDGEFPQGIEDLLAENNKIDNLFGDEGLISIVHTIGYHSREGESRMKRIAAQNQGQYRHVPKP